ncbi:hypothetical protein AN643_01255 [Candidatus Epulonipiscioides saccharophilum]|nr:hypothetical protein AN643_01255 [Epulopiscium sp. SCG-B10WGA-EpuloB]
MNVNGSGMFAGMANYGSTSYSVSYSPYAPSKSVTIGLPKTVGDLDFQSAFRNDELIGGKYNPASDKVEIKSSLPGEYIVKEHYQDFSDIASKDQQMQDAIKLLVSKDIIDGKTSTQFMPDDAIKRSELAVMLIKTIYMHKK